MIRYYDRRGNALPNMQAADWSDEGVRVASTALPGDVTVSTVHLVIDHNHSQAGPPLIFETLVLGGPLDGEMNRYSTEAEAREGHAEMVARVRAAQPTPDDDFGPFDLDDMPGITPLVHNLEVARNLTFVDPPPAASVKAETNRIVIVGPDSDDMRAWIDRRLELHEFSPGVDSRRSWYGVIEGVPVRVDCEVTA